jgi:hypothetical protein
MRTVTFVMGVSPRLFCDVAQAVTQVPDGARCACSSNARLSTTARMTATLDAKKRLVIVSSESYSSVLVYEKTGTIGLEYDILRT